MKRYRRLNPERDSLIKAERKARIREWYNALKQQLTCKDCGTDDFRVLQFHHRVPADKLKDIALLVTSSASTKTILAEMEKCDVLCANCHIIRHYNLRN